jgi:4-amino-4-deoxy-L-arabinose transferase-like glycosyltransferase
MIAAASRGWRPYAVLFLLCLGLYLPGIAALPVMDRDEARFAQATRQMLESGDYLDIRFGSEARNNKPAAIYWLQAAAVAALGETDSSAIWPYRVPSLIGATGAVLLTFFFGARLVGPAAALLGAALLASSLGLVAEAHLAKTDAVLLLTCVAGQGALAEIAAGRASRRWSFLFWLAEGASTLVKGPVGPGLALLTTLSLSLAGRDARWLKGLKPLWGVPLFLAIVLPWLIAISLATKGAFVSQSMGHDFLNKIIGAQESHGAWPGTYLLLLPVNFWPGSLLLGAAAVFAWRERGDPAVRFLIAWAVPFWIVLELVPTKLPHYMLPVFPALALLAGRAALDARAGLPTPWRRIVASIWMLATIAIAVVLAAAPLALGARVEAVGVAGALAVVAVGAALASRLWREVTPGLAPGVALLALCAVPALAVEAPRLHPLWLSREAAAMVTKAGTPRGAPVDVVGYDEPSLVFLLGTATVIATPEQAAANLASSPALVESRDDAAFLAAAHARGITAEALGRVAGLDYSNGKHMILTLYRGAAR